MRIRVYIDYKSNLYMLFRKGEHDLFLDHAKTTMSTESNKFVRIIAFSIIIVMSFCIFTPITSEKVDAASSGFDLQDAIDRATPGAIIDMKGQTTTFSSIGKIDGIDVSKSLTIKNGTIDLIGTSAVFLSASDITLDNLEINGDSSANASAGSVNIFIGKMQNPPPSLSNIDINNCTLNVGSMNADPLWEASGIGINVQSRNNGVVSDISIKDNEINSSTNARHPMYLMQAQDVNIDNNTVSGEYESSIGLDGVTGTVNNNEFLFNTYYVGSVTSIKKQLGLLSFESDRSSSCTVITDVSVDGNTFDAAASGSTNPFIPVVKMYSSVLKSFKNNKFVNIEDRGDTVPLVYLTNDPYYKTTTTNPVPISDTTTVFTGNSLDYINFTGGIYYNFAPSVSYDMQGYGTQVTKEAIGYGDKATEPESPTDPNGEFGGWYKEAACKNLWDFETALTSNATIYAKWTPYNIDVAVPAGFNVTGVTKTTQTMSWGQANNAMGYEIYRSTSKSGTYSFIKKTTSLSYTDTGLTVKTPYFYKIRAYATAGSKTFYSGFTAISSKQFKVTFKPNGSRVKGLSPTSKMVTYNSKYGALPKVKRTGYNFKGWYTEKSGGTKVTSKTRKTGASNKILYAHWSKNGKIKNCSVAKVHSKLNFRSPKSKVVKYVKKGQKICILKKVYFGTEPWYKIKVGTKTGYIDGRYVKRI